MKEENFVGKHFPISLRPFFPAIGVARLFVSVVISGIVLVHFWPTLSGPRPKQLGVVFRSSFEWKL